MPINYNEYETLDDVLMDVLGMLINSPFDVSPTRGSTSEVLGASFTLKNPLARLSRSETKGTVFSALGELIWYLAGSDNLDFIAHYIPRYLEETEDNKTIYGAYGPRLFNFKGQYNQIENIINLLKDRPSSRKAVIQLFDAQDLHEGHKEFPCTCTLQFLLRNDKLHLYVSMRSNDALYGLPHDVFAFTMLQEIIANTLSVSLGNYYHSVGSLHLYENKIKYARTYIEEGYQATKPVMPKMPNGNPWEAINKVIEIEYNLRKNTQICIEDYSLDPYWVDITTLLKVHSSFKHENIDVVINCLNKVNPIYAQYIEKRLREHTKAV